MANTEREMAALKRQLDDVAQRLADLSHEAIDQGEEEVDRYLEKMLDRVQDMNKALREKATYFKVKTQETAKQADEYVHENPWGVVAGAAGVGILIGLLLRSNRRD